MDLLRISARGDYLFLFCSFTGVSLILTGWGWLDDEALIQRQCQVVAGDLQWQVVENLLVWRFNSLHWDGNLLLHWKNLERKTWARAEISPRSKFAVLWHQSAKGCHSVQSFRPCCATHTVDGLGGHCKVGDPENAPSGSWGPCDGFRMQC